MTLNEDKIELFDNNNVARIRMGTDESGCPYLSLNGADGRERIILAVDSDGNGSIGFRVANGQPVVTLGVSPHSMGMTMIDVSNNANLALQLFDGEGELTIQNGDEIHTWPVKDKNKASGAKNKSD